MRAALIWAGLLALLVAPLVAAGMSPLLQWRQPIYIIAGFAGIVGLCLMLVQPLLAAGVLPGLERFRGRRMHRWVGASLVAAVLVHVVGLWIFSPPDVIDVLLFRSPAPFSVWGAVAMWAVFGAALLALFRRKLRLRVWRIGHSALVALAVIGTVVHTVLIEGTMEPATKIVLCAAVGLALGLTLLRLRAWERGR